eukprot:CAMPEP_0168326774 /NCGR_PEP_ID=MMETSP0213-20121227/5509_1 /TAXON_ID=151035 /ORGANISM="Euplotes harpa, Strain FSP1.4" /LENGTH=134 /DNA_ID=CAMNT_0008329565 /DNA_START=458 /DNA_END=862 /DNA_ORIENTATION=+
MTSRSAYGSQAELKKFDPQREMRKKIFTDSQLYLGFSSNKRTDLAQSLKLPPIFKSEMYKDKDPNAELAHKTLVQRRSGNDRYKAIREYSESRKEVLDTLCKPRLRNSTSIFGLQQSSNQGNIVVPNFGRPYDD